MFVDFCCFCCVWIYSSVKVDGVQLSKDRPATC